jgi:Fe-S cluster assembly iron-binding protein IscA
MLTVTGSAAAALRTVVGDVDTPGRAVRISKNESAALGANDSSELRLDVVTEIPADDEVVTAPGGLRVFVEVSVVPLVEDRVLDGSIDEVGRPALFLKAG